jgi:DNA-binding transcriptional ArsR family regulator
MIDKEAVRQRALELIAADGSNVARRLGAEFGLSRQVAHGHLRALERAGLVRGEGSTRARRYRLAALVERTGTYERSGLREDVVWREAVLPAVAFHAANVRDIWHYGITEMVNNAIDHSAGARVHVGVHRDAVVTEAWVADDGVGLFRKLQEAFGFPDPRDAILELAKGKLTTDPARHTGEGIFFTSKMFDAFVVRSGGLHFGDAEAFSPPDPWTDPRGTLVRMRLANASVRTSREIFDAFAAPEEYTFSKTVIPVRLAQYEGDTLVSRSQARRLTARFDRFRHVELDFSGIVAIGPAFADELFRVFPRAHPEVELTSVNLAPAVRQMRERATAEG